jgi:5-hydroxyisourate hydrolase-like protein (transthyretin family)
MVPTSTRFVAMRVTHFLPFVLCFGLPLAAHASEPVLSLCKPAEFVLANARVLRTDQASSGDPAEGKTVSLCSDRENEPYRSLTYRFGTPGRVEAEIVASNKKKAGIYMQSDSAAHLGQIAIVFYAKPYSYVVSEGVGMSNGLTLSVYERNVRVAAFSSLEDASKIVTIDPDVPKSPLFKRVEPMEPL